MPDRLSALREKVLHIRPEGLQNAQVDHLDALLAALSVPLEKCGDVYRGLARLCRDGAGAWCGVIVCVDGLGTAEMEFFSLASRLRLGGRVYVYGDERFASRMKRAIELGAAGRVTDAAIQSLCDVASTELRDADAAGAEGESQPSQAAHPSPVLEPNPKQTSLREETAEPPQWDEQVGTSPTARVPWVDYGDRPIRIRPGRRRAPTAESKAGERSATPSRPHEPLLTDEELRALVGDDVAGAASSRPTTRPKEESDGGSGGRA